MSNIKSNIKKDALPSFLTELNRMEKIKKHRHLNSSDKEKMRRLQGQLKALNNERESKGQLPLTIQDVEKPSTTSAINNSKIIPKTAAVIESAPQIRNLQKELTMFIPSTVIKRKNTEPINPIKNRQIYNK